MRACVRPEKGRFSCLGCHLSCLKISSMGCPCNLSPFLQFLHMWKSKRTFRLSVVKTKVEVKTANQKTEGRGEGGGETTLRITQRDSESTKSKQAKHLGVGEQKLSKRDWFKF